MRRVRVVFAGALVLLLLVFSFNAYACLISLFGTPQATMDSGCSDPHEQPARQFCDAFKTLGVQASPELHPVLDCQTLCPEDAVSLSLLFSLTAQSSRAFVPDGSDPPLYTLLLNFRI